MALPALVLVGLGLAPVFAIQDPVRLTPVTPLTTIALGAAPGGRVTDVQRLIDGRVLVVRAEPTALQVYQSDGALQRELFRAPPTERFKGRAILLGSSAGGISVSDDGDGTITRYSSTGVLLRTEPLRPSDYAVRFLLHRTTLLYDLTPASVGCVRQAVAALPATPAGVLREGRFDPLGRFWWRMADSSTWTVADVTGRTLARVALPEGFLLYQAGDGYVVGKVVGGGGERVQVLALRFPGPPPARPACMGSGEELKPDLDGTALLRAVMRAASGAMSRERARTGSYPQDLAVLPGSTQLPAGISLRVLRAGPSGFALFGEVTGTALRCLTAAGDMHPGLPEDYILCGS